MNQLTSDKLRAYLFCGYGRFNDQLGGGKLKNQSDNMTSTKIVSKEKYLKDIVIEMLTRPKSLLPYFFRPKQIPST
mgnify:CR=1 FL=1